MARPSDPNAKIDLLRAAESVFAEHGLDGAKVEEITARAGRSKGAFYLHFRHKEDAFRQIVESLLARLAACLEVGGRSDRGAPWAGMDGAALRSFWLDKDVEIGEFLWQNRQVVRLMLEGGGSALFTHLVDEFAERSREKAVQMLAWAVHAGIYRADLDIQVASLILSGAYDRVARQLVRMERKPDLRRLFHEVQRVLLIGLAGPELDRQVRNPAARPARAAKPGTRTRHQRL